MIVIVENKYEFYENITKNIYINLTASHIQGKVESTFNI
jgi:hypothetical protein